MKDLKTTIPGILGGLAIAAKSVFPEYAAILDLAAALFLSALGIFAAQTKKE